MPSDLPRKLSRANGWHRASRGRVGFYLIEIIELFSSVAFDPLDRQETHISCGFLRCLGEARTPPNAQTTPHPPTLSAPGWGLRAQYRRVKTLETYAYVGTLTLR
jgi:hypothetical protein